MTDSICAIGFSGHRELADPELARKKIAEVLENVAQRTQRRLIAVSSIAMGADILFVEICLAKGLPWIAILPMPATLFFNEKDFPDGQVRTQAMMLLQKATAVEITNPINSGNDLSTYRHAAFADSGQRIVDYSDAFLAVYRPSNEPLKPGGTGKIIDYAKFQERHLAIVNPDDGRVEHHHWPRSFDSGMIKEVGALREAPLRQELLTAESSPEFRSVVDWFARLSAAARRSVPYLRSLSSSAVILHGIAVTLALALITLPELLANPATVHAAEWAKGVIAGGAFVVTIWFLFGRPHERAARYRLGAEICRSLIATWDVPETHRQIFRGFPPEYGNFIKTLLSLRLLQRAPGTPAPSVGDDIWKKVAKKYKEKRIENQIHYYSGEQRKAEILLHVLEPLSWICAAGGLIFGVIPVAAPLLGLSVQDPGGRKHLEEFFEFGKVAFPFLAAMFISLIAAHEATRRKSRYAEMLDILRRNVARLDFAEHKEAACEIVIDNERALLAENVEWANMAKYPATG